MICSETDCKQGERIAFPGAGGAFNEEVVIRQTLFIEEIRNHKTTCIKIIAKIDSAGIMKFECGKRIGACRSFRKHISLCFLKKSRIRTSKRKTREECLLLFKLTGAKLQTGLLCTRAEFICSSCRFFRILPVYGKENHQIAEVLACKHPVPDIGRTRKCIRGHIHRFGGVGNACHICFCVSHVAADGVHHFLGLFPLNKEIQVNARRCTEERRQPACLHKGVIAVRGNAVIGAEIFSAPYVSLIHEGKKIRCKDISDRNGNQVSFRRGGSIPLLHFRKSCFKRLFTIFRTMKNRVQNLGRCSICFLQGRLYHLIAAVAKRGSQHGRSTLQFKSNFLQRFLLKKSTAIALVFKAQEKSSGKTILLGFAHPLPVFFVHHPAFRRGFFFHRF